MSDGGTFKEYLTVRDHLDPDKHWIGDALPAPTQGELAATVGTLSGPGDSPFPARADHMHKVDPTLLPSLITYTPTFVNMTLGTGGAIAAHYVNMPIQGTTQKMIHVQVSVAFGTSAAFTSDVTVTLPVAPSHRFVGIGTLIITGGIRYFLSWSTTATSVTTTNLRALTYRPTATESLRTVEFSSAMSTINPAPGLTTGDTMVLYGDYISVL